MPYDLNAIRQKMKQMDGRRSDPDEFRPAKAKPGEVLKYRFFILPGVLQGDKLKSGVATKSMDMFFVNYGQHWIKQQPHVCPRIYEGSECELCSFGLKLLRDKTLSESDRQQIRQDWLPSSAYVVNIYFSNWKTNPEEVRGKVMYYKAPKTLFDKWSACINNDAPDQADGGDDDDPQAYGAFFDENSAWLFELQVELSGKSNGYKTSKFVIGADRKPTPIVKDEAGKPNKKAIDAVLASRIDICARLEPSDQNKIRALANSLIHGEDEPVKSGFQIDEEEEEKVVAPKKAKPDPIVESKKPTPVIEDEDDDDDSIGGSDLDSLLGQLDDD